jgi:hypothetical protein
MEPVASTPAALARTQREDHAKWGRLITEQRILPE